MRCSKLLLIYYYYQGFFISRGRDSRSGDSSSLMLLFLPSALSLETLSFFFASYTLSTYAPGYLKTRTCRISGRVSLNKAAKKSTEELSNHFALSASQFHLRPGIRIFDWAIIGRPPIGFGLGLSPSHRLFWSTHVAQLHCISLYLAIEGLPPNLVPVPPCSARGPLAALLSPVPVQSSPVPDTSIRCTSLDRRPPCT